MIGKLQSEVVGKVERLHDLFYQLLNKKRDLEYDLEGAVNFSQLPPKLKEAVIEELEEYNKRIEGFARNSKLFKILEESK